MEKIIAFLKSNYEWIFSGIGATIIVGLVGLFLKKKNGVFIKQKQKTGDGSISTQIGQINEKKYE